MEETSAPPPRQQQTFRSTASTNWRMKDDSPRPDQQQRRTGYNRDRNDKQGGNSQTYSRNSNFQQSSDEAAGTRLYVGNLLYSAQRSDIEELFTGSGCNVVNISISTDPFSGRNPSYCFVDLESAEEAQRAMSELNGVDFMGRSLRVSPGVAKRQVQGSGAGRGELRTRDYEGGQRRPRGTRDVREQRDGDYQPTFDRWNRTDAPSHYTAPQSEGRRLYFGKMPRLEPQSANDQEIQELFAQYAPGINISAVSKQISPRNPPASEQTGNQYYCFVDLENVQDVDAAIEALDGKPGSWGGNIRVNRAKHQADRKVVREQGSRNQERQPMGEEK